VNILGLPTTNKIWEFKIRLPSRYKNALAGGRDDNWDDFINQVRSVERDIGIETASTTIKAEITKTKFRSRGGGNAGCGRGLGRGRIGMGNSTRPLYGREPHILNGLRASGHCYNCLEHGYIAGRNAPCAGQDPCNIRKVPKLRHLLNNSSNA
jgi:hypothetical protein